MEYIDFLHNDFKNAVQISSQQFQMKQQILQLLYQNFSAEH